MALFPFEASVAADGGVACADLAKLSLPGVTITSATEVTAPFTASAGGGSATITIAAPFAFCRVAAKLTPSTDSDIQAEVWLPTPSRWNGKFLGVGNGGLTGAIWHTSMVRPLQRGYAVAGSFGTILLGRRLVPLNSQQLQKEADFRYALGRVREHAEAVARHSRRSVLIIH